MINDKFRPPGTDRQRITEKENKTFGTEIYSNIDTLYINNNNNNNNNNCLVGLVVSVSDY